MDNEMRLQLPWNHQRIIGLCGLPIVSELTQQIVLQCPSVVPSWIPGPRDSRLFQLRCMKGAFCQLPNVVQVEIWGGIFR